MLQEADARDASWGFALWHRLTAHSLVNSHACRRAGLFPTLLERFAAAAQPSDAPGAPPPPPAALLVRLALLMQVRCPALSMRASCAAFSKVCALPSPSDARALLVRLALLMQVRCLPVDSLVRCPLHESLMRCPFNEGCVRCPLVERCSCAWRSSCRCAALPLCRCHGNPSQRSQRKCPRHNCRCSEDTQVAVESHEVCIGVFCHPILSL